MIGPLMFRLIFQILRLSKLFVRNSVKLFLTTSETEMSTAGCFDGKSFLQLAVYVFNSFSFLEGQKWCRGIQRHWHLMTRMMGRLVFRVP